jgi:predicted Zn-dependent protease
VNKNDLVLAANVQGTAGAIASADGYSFEALVLHELGHFLGLKHTAESGSVMVTHLAANNDRVALSASDAQSIQCVYK